MAYYLGADPTGGPNSLFFDVHIDWPTDQILEGLQVPKHALGLFKVTSPQRQVPDLIFFSAYSYGVSIAALQLLNELASENIEGIPIDIVDKNDFRIPGDYFYLNVMTFRDSLILDETNCKIIDNLITQRDGTKKNLQIRIIDHTKLRAKKSEIKDAHIWHEQYAERRRRHELFASNMLIKMARVRGLRGFDRAVPIIET